MLKTVTPKLTALCAAALLMAASAAQGATVTYSGQGLTFDGTTWSVNTELCGMANGAQKDGSYILFVLSSTGSTAIPTITGPWVGAQPMTQSGNGSWKYVSDWFPLAGLAGNVVATYTSGKKGGAVQLVVSHGCPPPPPQNGAFCSPGFWANATDAAWALTGYSRASLFNATVYNQFYGDSFGADPTLNTVLTTNGGTYKGSGVSGTDPRTAAPNALSAFNAVGAFLSDHIPGYVFDPAMVGPTEVCPIDHFGNFNPQ